MKRVRRAPLLLLVVFTLPSCAATKPGADAAPPPAHTPPQKDTETREPTRADRSLGAYERACELGSARGCNDLGVKYLEGDGVPKDEGRAAALLRKSCAGRLPMGCFNFGWLQQQGIGVPQDASSAEKHYTFACDQEIGAACNALALILTDEREPPDNERALPLFEKACGASVPAACMSAGAMYQNGDGVSADPTTAARLYRLSCEGDIAIGCVALGNLTLEGEAGLVKSPTRALDLYRRGCDLDPALGCYAYGMALTGSSGIRPDLERAEKTLDRACRAGHADACAELASLLEQ